MFNKEEARKVMYEFLKEKGFPNIDAQQVIDALPDMYRLLEEKKLLPDKMTFAIFKKIALSKYREEKIMADMKKHMRNFGVNI